MLLDHHLIYALICDLAESPQLPEDETASFRSFLIWQFRASVNDLLDLLDDEKCGDTACQVLPYAVDEHTLTAALDRLFEVLLACDPKRCGVKMRVFCRLARNDERYIDRLMASLRTAGETAFVALSRIARGHVAALRAVIANRALCNELTFLECIGRIGPTNDEVKRLAQEISDESVRLDVKARAKDIVGDRVWEFGAL